MAIDSKYGRRGCHYPPLYFSQAIEHIIKTVRAILGTLLTTVQAFSQVMCLVKHFVYFLIRKSKNVHQAQTLMAQSIVPTAGLGLPFDKWGQNEMTHILQCCDNKTLSSFPPTCLAFCRPIEQYIRHNKMLSEDIKLILVQQPRPI